MIVREHVVVRRSELAERELKADEAVSPRNTFGPFQSVRIYARPSVHQFVMFISMSMDSHSTFLQPV